MSLNHTIGLNNQLPWHLPAEWAYFKASTTGRPFIMGRKSFDSPDALLSDKHNYILSRQRDLFMEEDNVTVVSSMEEALKLNKKEKEIFILGGASVFEQMLGQADYLYLTLVHELIEGDAFFPSINWFEWELIRGNRYKKDGQNKFTFSMNVYRSKKARNQDEIKPFGSL